MSREVFDTLVRGLEEAGAYLEGERKGYKVTLPPSVDESEHPSGGVSAAIGSESTGEQETKVRREEA